MQSCQSLDQLPSILMMLISCLALKTALQIRDSACQLPDLHIDSKLVLAGGPMMQISVLIIRGLRTSTRGDPKGLIIRSLWIFAR